MVSCYEGLHDGELNGCVLGGLMRNRNVLKIILVLFMCAGVIVSCVGCKQLFMDTMDAIFPPAEWHEVTDLQFYGVLEGNNNNEIAEEMFAKLFPPQIEESFREVTYSYKAVNIDVCAFEIYLEFVIEDPTEFQAYVTEIAPLEDWLSFEFDEAYLEYTYSDWYDGDYNSDRGYYDVASVGIEKVLMNPEEQRIIIVALEVRNGGGIRSDDFTRFFDRFGLDPVEYAKRPDYNEQDILNGEHLIP